VRGDLRLNFLIYIFYLFDCLNIVMKANNVLIFAKFLDPPLAPSLTKIDLGQVRVVFGLEPDATNF